MDTAAKLEESGDLPDLVVSEGESRVLSSKSDQMRSFYQEFKLKTAAEVKDLLGVPEGSSARAGVFSAADVMKIAELPKKTSKAVLERSVVGRSNAAFSKRAGLLPTKVIAVNRLIGDEIDEEEKLENRALARVATEAYVYGDSAEVAAWQPLIEAYIEYRGPIVIVPIFGNITVSNNATLSIASDTLAVYANRIKLYGTGKINCDGPKTFHCSSFEGFL